jgi:hypothetical protein
MEPVDQVEYANADSLKGRHVAVLMTDGVERWNTPSRAASSKGRACR